jgi:flavorubredoxin
VTIYYSTTGRGANTDLTEYTGPILVNVKQTVNAVAVLGSESSAVASAEYVIIGSPTALAEPATAISTPTATLNAVVNTNGLVGSYVFQYGTSATALTTSTAKTALPAATTATPVNVQITGLASGTAYYYQVVVTTAAGTTSGAVLSFTTN